MSSDPLGAGEHPRLKNISTNETWQHSALSRRGAPAGEWPPIRATNRPDFADHPPHRPDAKPGHPLPEPLPILALFPS